MKKIILIAGVFLISISSAYAKYKPKQKGLYARIKTTKGEIVVKLFEKRTPVTVSNFVGLAEGTKEWLDPKTKQKVKKPFYNGLIFHRVIKDFMIQGGCPLGNGTGGPGYKFKDECYKIGEQVTGKIQDEKSAIAVWHQLISAYYMQHKGKLPNKKLEKLMKEVQAKKNLTPLYGKNVKYYQKQTGINKPVFRKELIHPVSYGALAMANSGPDTNGSQFFIVTKKGGCSWLNGRHTVFGKVVHGMEVVHKIENTKTGANDKPVKDIKIKSIKIQRVE